VAQRDVYAWLEEGLRAGYCSEVVCSTHDGMPFTEAEYEDDDGDPCIPAVRVFERGAP
jgi:hypothetical protein